MRRFGWQKSLVLALIMFISIPFITRSYFIGPCEILALHIKVDVDGQPLQIELPLEEPIQVKPETPIVIRAEIETNPENCQGNFRIDWRLLPKSNPSELETISETSTREVLKITVGAEAEEDLITLVVLDAFGRVRETAFLLLKVRGE